MELLATVPLLSFTEVLVPPTKAPPPEFVKVPDPQPVRDVVKGLATITPAGRESVSVVLVRAVAVSLLVMTIASWLTCPAVTVLGVKLLLNEGGWTEPTCKVALAGVVL